jgi:hypothetical protein
MWNNSKSCRLGHGGWRRRLCPKSLSDLLQQHYFHSVPSRPMRRVARLHRKTTRTPHPAVPPTMPAPIRWPEKANIPRRATTPARRRRKPRAPRGRVPARPDKHHPVLTTVLAPEPAANRARSKRGLCRASRQPSGLRPPLRRHSVPFDLPERTTCAPSPAGWSRVALKYPARCPVKCTAQNKFDTAGR